MRIRAFMSFAAASALALSACDGGGEAGFTPQADPVQGETAGVLEAVAPLEAGALVVSAADVAMGEAPLGDWRMESISLHNPGPGDAPLDRVVVDGPAGVQVQVLGRVARPGQPAVFGPGQVLRAGDLVRVDVIAQPEGQGPWEAAVAFEGAADAAAVEVALSGHVTLDAVTPVVQVLEGAQVAMPPLGPVDVHLSGALSASPHGAVVDYEWRAESPDGGQAVLLPNAFVPTPTLRVTEAGRFDVRLVVRDEAGHVSPVSKPVPVFVEDESAIRVDVTWSGRDAADLDVHLVHPSGYGLGQDVDQDGVGDGWFDASWDAWQDNPQPLWTTGAPGGLTAPVVSSDAAREVVVLPVAMADGAYRVGVHVIEGGDDEPVVAEVTVRVGGDVVWTSQPMELHEGDLWDVGAVSWPDAAIERPVDGGEERVVPSVAIP